MPDVDQQAAAMVEQRDLAASIEKLQTAQFIVDHRRQVAADGQRMADALAAAKQRQAADQAAHEQRVKAARDKLAAAIAEHDRVHVYMQRTKADLADATRQGDRVAIIQHGHRYESAKRQAEAAQIARDEAQAALNLAE
jgi:hypothetical protein